LNKLFMQRWLVLLSALVAASCGGGGGSSSSVPPPPPPDGNATRIDAANKTAQNNASCQAVQPFYWEIGDTTGALGSGSAGTGAPDAGTAMNIASASKWLFAAYVVQMHGDVPANRPYLNFTSGYSNFDNALCASTQTVAECNNGVINLTEANAHTFHYQGGHMQRLAVDLGLGGMNVLQLASEVNAGIGNDVGVAYVEPQPPGGVRTNARSYAVFLRKLLKNSPSPLQLGPLLGTQAVCVHPSATCSASSETANALPEDFHYSLGHWVEDDPATTPSTPVDNRAYSSAGAFGFYPWVDFDRTLYGIVARQDSTGETAGTGEGYSSLKCGRLIRLAWKTGTQQ